MPSAVARVALLVLPALTLGCRDRQPAVPPPATPPVPTAAAAEATTGPAADALAAAQAYLADHHLNWGTCLFNVPTYDGGARLTFARTDGMVPHPHALVVHADRSVTIVPDP